jgi:hypothetical protein
MNNFIQYAAYAIPTVFILLSQIYRIRFNKLKRSGQIPQIMQAKKLQNTYMTMAVLSGVVILICMQF